jgi:catechol 2,3-dioxygenase-like lactoylglutathione lyase family enzyme
LIKLPKELLSTVLMILVTSFLSLGLLTAAVPAPVDDARPPITGYSHIALYEVAGPVTDNFYAAQFGWPRVKETRSDGLVHYRVSAEQYIEIIPPPPGFDPSRSVVDHIAFATTAAERMRRYLKRQGIEVPDHVTRQPDGRLTFQVHDFENNKVEFVQGGAPQGTLGPAAVPAVSTHLIHMGLATANADAMRRFYSGILGFRPFWKGWRQPGIISWEQVQVPDGTDWFEFMLVLPPTGTEAQLRLADHYSPGMSDVDTGLKLLRDRGLDAPEHKMINPILDGRPKWSTHDPSGTRVELMEFQPVVEPCCTPYLGPQPTH